MCADSFVHPVGAFDKNVTTVRDIDRHHFECPVIITTRHVQSGKQTHKPLSRGVACRGYYVRVKVREGTAARAELARLCPRHGRTTPEAPMQYVERSLAARNALEETSQIPVILARRAGAPPPLSPPGPDFDSIQRSPEFVTLRQRMRRFVFPMSLIFFTWYMTFVLLAAYAHDFMSLKVFGEVNIAIVLGLLQFVTTIVISAAYVRFANRRLDPQVAKIRRLVGVDR
jgi:uncharacterized membrane protein (DUF485 family)